MCLTRRQNGHSCTGKHGHYYHLLLLSPSRHAAVAAAAPALSPLTCVSWHGYSVCHRGTIRQPFPESAQRAGGPITGIRGGGGSKAADDSGKPGRLCWRSNKAGRAAKRKAASTGNRQHVLSSPAIRRPGVIPDFSQPLPAAKPLSPPSSLIYINIGIDSRLARDKIERGRKLSFVNQEAVLKRQKQLANTFRRQMTGSGVQFTHHTLVQLFIDGKRKIAQHNITHRHTLQTCTKTSANVKTKKNLKS